MDPVWELIQRAQAGDTEAFNQLMEENQGLVWSIVRRYMGRGQEPEDLFQIGSLGLVKAIRRFDTKYETRLSTYAVPMIAGEIQRFLRDDGMVKVSRRIQGQALEIKRASERWTQKNGRDPTVTELEQETGLSQEEIVLALGSTEMIESLDEPDANERIKETADTRFDEKERLLNRIFIEDLLGRLSREDRELIEMRYVNEWTQTDIARKKGISQVQVCRMEKRILQQMRKYAI